MSTNIIHSLKKAKKRLIEELESQTIIPLVDVSVKNQRYDICISCEHLLHITKQCMKCGCYMPAKTSLVSAKCPIKKW